MERNTRYLRCWRTIRVRPIFYLSGVNVINSDGTRGSVSVKRMKQPMVFESAEKEQQVGRAKCGSPACGDDKASRQLDEFDLPEL